MNICKECGSQVEQGLQFCTKCGGKIKPLKNVKLARQKNKSSKFIIGIVIIVAAIFLGVVFGKDKILCRYYTTKADKESVSSVSTNYYIDALKLNYSDDIIEKINNKIIKDENFEDTLLKLKGVVKKEDLKKMYLKAYVNKAKENFNNKNYETTWEYLNKAQNYNYNIEQFEYYKDLVKIKEEEKRESKQVVSYESEIQNNKQEYINNKQKYINKLESIENEAIQAHENYGSGESSVAEYGVNLNTIFNKYDAVINEIYSDLKQNLPYDEMNELKEKQISWIADKEKSANEINKYHSENKTNWGYIQLNDELGELTKKRCYELLNYFS